MRKTTKGYLKQKRHGLLGKLSARLLLMSDVVGECGLSPEAVVAQSYDGASVMSSTSVM